MSKHFLAVLFGTLVLGFCLVCFLGAAVFLVASQRPSLSQEAPTVSIFPTAVPSQPQYCEGSIGGVPYRLEPGQSNSILNPDRSITVVECTSAGFTQITVKPAPSPVLPPPSPTSVTRQWFQLVNRHSQKCLTVEFQDDHVVQQPCYFNRDSQLFRLPESLFATTSLTPLQAKNGLCIGTKPGAFEVVKSSCTDALVWKLDPISTSWAGVPYPVNFPHGHAIVQPIESGPYYLIKYGNQCLDLESWEHGDGMAIIHYDCAPHTEDMDNQLWAKH